MTSALAVTAPGPVPRPAPGVWWARIARCLTAPAEHSLVAVRSDRFPPGTPVDLAVLNARGRRPAGWLVDLRYRTGDGAVVALDVAPGLCGLPLWFSEAHHAGAPIPAVTLAAQIGGGVPPGSLLPPCGPTAIGRLRWQLRSGLVEVHAVQPGFLGRGIDRVLPVAAEALAVLRGWPAPHADPGVIEPVARAGVERLVGDLPARLI